MSPFGHTCHSHNHNIMWYSKRVILYIIKEMMTLSTWAYNI